jgi:hypothetical protein
MSAYTWTLVTPVTAGQRAAWAVVFMLLAAGALAVIRDAARIIAGAVRQRKGRRSS